MRPFIAISQITSNTVEVNFKVQVRILASLPSPLRAVCLVRRRGQQSDLNFVVWFTLIVRCIPLLRISNAQSRLCYAEEL